MNKTLWLIASNSHPNLVIHKVYRNTGHNIHNERKNEFIEDVSAFLISFGEMRRFKVIIDAFNLHKRLMQKRAILSENGQSKNFPNRVCGKIEKAMYNSIQ